MKINRKLLFGVMLLALGIVQVSCKGDEKQEIVVQAHRGGAALYPENTIPAMIHAVKTGTRTLELDLQVTRDNRVVVSHDAFLNSMKTLSPSGERISKEQEDALWIFRMDYDSLRKFDVGSLENPQYPGRKNLKCPVPLLSNLIDCVETYTYGAGIKPVCYNIEIKSSPEKDGSMTPEYTTFCDLSMRVLQSKNLKDRLCIQSFDVRSLQYIHQNYPDVKLSYLVEDEGLKVSDFLKRLDFVPAIISPCHTLVDRDFVSEAQAFRMKVIPWTVDTKDEVLRLRELGVDELITNRPDSVQTWLKEADHHLSYKKAVRFYENVMGY